MPNNLIKHLSLGEVCAFETDTVVGVGCSAFLNNGQPNFKGVNQIFSIKKRDTSKKLPWLVGSVNMLMEYVPNIPENANDLLSDGWPQHTTLIFKVNNNVPEKLTLNNSVAFRVPSNNKLTSIIESVGCPIITTSANFSGEVPYSQIEDVPKAFLNLIDYCCSESFYVSNDVNARASKIIDCTGPELKIIRN